MSGILQCDVLTIIFIQPTTLMTLHVSKKGLVFIYTQLYSQVKTHFSIHMQISEEQRSTCSLTISGSPYEGYFKFAQCMLVA